MSRWRRIFTVVHNFVEEELASVLLQPKVAIIAGTRLIFHFLAVYLLAHLAFRCSSLPHHQPALRLLLPQMGFCCSCSAHLVVNMSSTLLSSTDGDRGKIDRGKNIPPDQCPHNSSSLHHQKSGGLVVAVVVTISLSKLSPAHNSR